MHILSDCTPTSFLYSLVNRAPFAIPQNDYAFARLPIDDAPLTETSLILALLEMQE